MATLGQKRVVVGFNPSGNQDVEHIKVYCADLIDYIDNIPNTNSQTGRWKSLAITALEDASTYGVKAATAGQDESIDA